MLVFWEVDCQKDFLNNPDGKLYIPEAEKIKPNLQKLTVYGVYNEIILASRDCHFETDKELNTFPPHCMNGTDGYNNIKETMKFVGNPLIIRDKVSTFGRYDNYPYDELRILLNCGHKKIIFEKQHTDVFTNPNVIKVLRILTVSDAVVYGVATEYCVKDAVIGLLSRGIKVKVVEDAITGLDMIAEHNAIVEMEKKGAKFVKTEDVLNGL